MYLKPPFGGPEVVLKYLAGYTHRGPISNRRLVDLDGGRVTFTAKDGGTLVTIHSTFPSIEARDGVVSFGAIEYGKSSWDKMAAFAEAKCWLTAWQSIWCCRMNTATISGGFRLQQFQRLPTSLP